MNSEPVMLLEPRTFYTEKIVGPTSPITTPLLPSLSSMSMDPLTIPSFRRLPPFVSATSRSTIPRSSFDNQSKVQRHFQGSTNKDCLFNVANQEIRSVTRQLSTATPSEPTKDGFEFIQINEPSGKTDSAAGANMRAHIMRQFHERRRRQTKARVRPPAVALAPHQSLTPLCTGSHQIFPSQTTSIFSQNVQRATVSQGLLLASAAPCLQANVRAAVPSTPGAKAKPKTMKSKAICVRCGSLLLQETPNGDWNLQGNGSGVPLGLMGMDPFDSSAIPINHKMHGLIHHFIYRIFLHLSPRIYQGDGFRDLMNLCHFTVAMSDPVSVRAIVATAAAHLSTMKMKGSSLPDRSRIEQAEEDQDFDDALYHMSDGVRILNERFCDPKQALTVTSLLGASLLGICSTYLGNEALVETHHKGLLKMIALRGGIRTLPRELANQVLRSHVNIAFKKKIKPKLPMYKSRFRQNGIQYSVVEICNRSEAELFPSNQPFVVLAPAGSPFCHTRFDSFLSAELFVTACDLHNLSYMLDLNARHPRFLGSVQREFFEDSYVAVFHSLVSFPHPNDAGVLKTVDYYKQHTWRVAAFIYLNTGIREFDASFHSNKSLILEFISALQASELESTWTSSPEVLVWMLFVATCGTWERKDRGWLLAELRRGIRILGIVDVGQFEDFLKTMIMVESMITRHLSIIWQELNG